MTIPPRFLDELRSRIAVSDIVGKRVKLTRAGREYKACCPFHNEKSPSFYVNDDKQFYHCFGCGAHGSIIDFVMRYDNQSFPEAIETLAQMVGMQVPQSAPEDIEKAKQQKDLYTMLDETAKWMETQFRNPANKAAYDYMRERGVGEDVMTAFRIGYAPPDMQAVRKHLAGLGYTDAQMIEGGVLKASDKGKEPYAFFRERVMFPVPDRRGRIVAFGGRVLPEHLRSPDREGFKPPKYINSSDTPLFHKGKMLYGEPHARQAANDGQPVIVVEGYLDVIACFKAGYKGAVAPLGTALTEDQILVLWKMIPEESKIPVLCFDGDNAGRRAASRACERILPLLKPDHSAKIAFLPEGEDPDSLVKAKGRDALQAVLESAMNLVDFLWFDHTDGKSFDTPESRAGLTRTLMEDVAGHITDRTVQHFYKEAFREKIRKAFSPQTGQQQGQGFTRKTPWQPRGAYGKPAPLQPVAPLRRPSFARNGLVPMVLLAAVINSPAIFLDIEEEFGHLHLPENRLDRLRQAVLSTLGSEPALDGRGLRTHLIEQGFEAELGHLLSEQVYTHASFSRPSVDEAAALAGWREAWKTMQGQAEGMDLEQARIAFKDDINKENEARWENLHKRPKSSDG